MSVKIRAYFVALLFVLPFVLMAAWSEQPPLPPPPPRPRMERIYGEPLPGRVYATFYHDREGGGEYVCFYTDTGAPGVYNSIAVGCSPTGRNWKK